MHHRVNGFERNGFTFIEIVIALAIIGLLAAVIVPNLRRRSPKYEREQFVGHLNALTQFAWQSAITTGKLHRIFLHIQQRKITVEQATAEKDMEDVPIFKPVRSTYLKTEYVWPKQLSLRDAYIDGQDILSLFDKAYEAWFYLIPSGLAQEVILNFEDSKDRLAGRPRQLGLVLNPFSAQFKAYDTFQKP